MTRWIPSYHRLVAKKGGSIGRDKQTLLITRRFLEIVRGFKAERHEGELSCSLRLPRTSVCRLMCLFKLIKAISSS